MDVIQAKQSLYFMRYGASEAPPYPNGIYNKLQRAGETKYVGATSNTLKIVDGKLCAELTPSIVGTGKKPIYDSEKKYAMFKIEEKYNVTNTKSFFTPYMLPTHIRYESNGEFDLPNPSNFNIDNPSNTDLYDFSFDSRIVGTWDGLGCIKYPSWTNDVEESPTSDRPWIITDATLNESFYEYITGIYSYAVYPMASGFYVSYVTLDSVGDLYLNLSKMYQDSYQTINSIKIFTNGTDNVNLRNYKVLAMTSSLIYIAQSVDNTSLSTVIKAYSYNSSGISALDWSYNLYDAYNNRWTLGDITDSETTSTGIYIVYGNGGYIHITSSGVTSAANNIFMYAYALMKSKDNYFYWIAAIDYSDNLNGIYYLFKTTEDLTQTEIWKTTGDDNNPSYEPIKLKFSEIITKGYNYTSTKSIILFQREDDDFFNPTNNKIIKINDSTGQIEYEIDNVLPIFCSDRKVYYYNYIQTGDERFTIHSLDFLLDSTYETMYRGHKIDLTPAYIRPKYQIDIYPHEDGTYIVYPIYANQTGLTGETTYTKTEIYFETFEVSVVKDGTNGESRLKFFLELNLNLAGVQISIGFPEHSSTVSGTSDANGEITIYSPYFCGDNLIESWGVSSALDIGGTPAGYIYTPENNTVDFLWTGTYYFSNGSDYTLALPTPTITWHYFTSTHLKIDYTVGTYKSIPLQYRVHILTPSDNPSDNPSIDDTYSQWRCTQSIAINKNNITFPYSIQIECKNPYTEEITESIIYTYEDDLNE